MTYPIVSFDRYLEEVEFQRTFQTAQYNTDDVRKDLGDEDAQNRYFTIEACWRDDEDGNRMGAISSVFPSYRKLQEYIAEVRQIYIHNMPTDAEPLEKRMWWRGTWWERGDKHNVPFQHFALDAIGKLICFGFSMDYALTERSKLYGNPHFLARPSNVQLPFKTGDILDFDPQPFGKPFQVVLGVTEDCMEVGSMECIYASPTDGTLKLGHGSQFSRTKIPCQYSPLPAYQMAEVCNNEMLVFASELLKKTPKRDLDDFWRDLRYTLGRRGKEAQREWLQEQIGSM